MFGRDGAIRLETGGERAAALLPCVETPCSSHRRLVLSGSGPEVSARVARLQPPAVTRAGVDLLGRDT